MYYDEAVPKVEALYEEIYQLSAELGRDIRPKEQPMRNQRVSDRAALRFACKFTLQGVDSENIPDEYYEPGFVSERVAATADALRVLRPLGWKPVDEGGKVWLKPTFRPLTEADAAAQLGAEKYLADQEAPDDMHTASPLHVKRTNAQAEQAGLSAHGESVPSHTPSFRTSINSVAGTDHQLAQSSTAPYCTLDAERPPPMYEPRFEKFMDMSRLRYEELEDDNKREYVQMFEEQY